MPAALGNSVAVRGIAGQPMQFGQRDRSLAIRSLGASPAVLGSQPGAWAKSRGQEFSTGPRRGNTSQQSRHCSPKTARIPPDGDAVNAAVT